MTSFEEIEPSQECPVRVTHPDPAWRMTLQPSARVERGWYALELRFPPEGVVEASAHVSFVKAHQFWLRIPVIRRNRLAAVLRIPHELEQLTLLLTGSGHLAVGEISLTQIGSWSVLSGIARRGWQV